MTWPPVTWGELPLGTVIINGNFSSHYIVTDDARSPTGREPNRIQLLCPENGRYYWQSRSKSCSDPGYRYIAPHPEIEEDPF